MRQKERENKLRTARKREREINSPYLNHETHLPIFFAGNVTVFFTLVTSRSRKTRISVIILHLTIADLLVTFILLPTEVREELMSSDDLCVRKATYAKIT